LEAGVIRGLVYFTGLATLFVVGAIAAVAFRVDRWPWRDYAETGRKYVVKKLEEAEFEKKEPEAEVAPKDEPQVRPATYEKIYEAPLAVRHTVSRGETLYRIAKRYYGDPERWRVIADANGIAKPSDLRVGMTLLIPLARTIAQKDRRSWPEPRLAMTPAFTLGETERPETGNAGREEGDAP
jgi:LysM repeat protein